MLSEEWFLPPKLRLSTHTNWWPPSSLSGTLRHSLLGSCSFSPKLLQIQLDKLETHHVIIFNTYLQLYKL